MLTTTPEMPGTPKPADASALLGVLAPHFAALDDFLREQIAEFEPEIQEFASYCLDSGGKRIRPALVFFSGWQESGEVTPALVRAAGVIEMVHLATLVHDDIMDAADLRRSRRTAARAFGADTAVLVGDALFSQALSIAAQFPTTEVCRHVSVATRRVCAGEIMQTLRRGDKPADLAHYHRVIELKTAELFQVSCFLGSRLSGLDEAGAAAAGRFGRHLGTAYQIYDDLADFFGDEKKIGKTLGTDLASGKATLPLLLLLDRLPEHEAGALRREMAAGDARQIERRTAQMVEHGVRREVLGAIDAEIEAALVALAGHGNPAGARRLHGLADLLRAQAAGLRRA